MIQHDYRCQKCGRWSEILWESFAQFRKDVSCPCGGTATQTWRKAPGLAGVWEPGQRGVTPTFRPGQHDVQAGRSFDTLSERNRYLKDRGLVALGPDEYKRTVNSANERDVELPDIGEVMKEAWEEAQSSREPEPLPSVDAKDVTITGDLFNG